MQRQTFFSSIRFSRVLWLSLLVIMLGGLLKSEAAFQTVSFVPKTDFSTGNQFETPGYVAPLQGTLARSIPGSVTQQTSGDVSALNVGISDAADFLVIDPAGHRNGVDPATGQVVEEIANSVYFVMD